MYLSLYCKGSKRVTQGLRVRGSWRPNRNFNILTPTLMAVNVVSFSFSWCSTGGPGIHSAGCWFSLLHLISIFSGPPTHQGFPRAPSAGCGFLYHISSITPTPTGTGTRTVLTSILTELYNSSMPTRMFNRHQAEITVMQFRGHSLPVRQSMRVSWDFLACPILLANFRPSDFFS